MENQIQIDNRHRVARKRIIVGAIMALVPTLFLMSLPSDAGLGLLPVLPVFLILIVGGFFWLLSGLFMRFQSGETKELSPWITYSLLLVVLAVGIYFVNAKFRRGAQPTVISSVDYQVAPAARSQVSPVATTQVIAQVTPVSTAVSGNVVTVKDWGFSFVKPTSYEIVGGYPNASRALGANRILLCNEKCDDSITIDYIQGGSVTSYDSKFGDTTMYYDSTAKQWMEKGRISERDGNYVPDHPVEPGLYADGLPVFSSTGRWMSYIVPLSPAKILLFNITGSGVTQPLTDLVKTLKKI